MLDARPFDRQSLEDLFVEASDRDECDADNPFVRAKPHLAYLEGYLQEIGCTTIVVERDYVDRDFLEDFAAYHVRSFCNYKQRCIRLHFFSDRFDANDLTDAILHVRKRARLQGSYQGFVVLRPLPVAVMGRTCLMPYTSKDKAERLYPTTYRQDVDLWGIPLHVETVAFQEQDKDVAACATSALWSILQCTARKFQHVIPSPVAITGTAATTGGYETRVLPNVSGLTVRQIADALRWVGMEPYLYPLEAELIEEEEAELTEDELKPLIARKRLELKIAVAAYLRAGIPCLLLLSVPRREEDAPQRRSNHAVAVTGYGLGPGPPVGYGETQTLFDSSRIDKLYVHDDQLGPFARMCFVEDGQLATAGGTADGGRDLRAHPVTLVLPLHHKIRIPLGTVLDLALMIGKQVDAIRSRMGTAPADLEGGLVWDVRLSSLFQLRQDVLQSSLPAKEKLRLLSLPMPKYIWRLVGLAGAKPLFELLLDATDLMQGRLLLDVIAYSDEVTSYVGITLQAGAAKFADNPALRAIQTRLGGIPALNGLPGPIQSPDR